MGFAGKGRAPGLVRPLLGRIRGRRQTKEKSREFFSFLFSVVAGREGPSREGTCPLGPVRAVRQIARVALLGENAWGETVRNAKWATRRRGRAAKRRRRGAWGRAGVLAPGLYRAPSGANMLT